MAEVQLAHPKTKNENRAIDGADGATVHHVILSKPLKSTIIQPSIYELI